MTPQEQKQFSRIMAGIAKARWSKVPKSERSKHAKMMVNIREKKRKKLST